MGRNLNPKHEVSGASCVNVSPQSIHHCHIRDPVHRSNSRFFRKTLPSSGASLPIRHRPILRIISLVHDIKVIEPPSVPRALTLATVSSDLSSLSSAPRPPMTRWFRRFWYDASMGNPMPGNGKGGSLVVRLTTRREVPVVLGL